MISLVLDFLIGRGTLYTVYKLSQNGSVKFLHIGVLLYDADKRFNDVAAISVMNICVSVKRKPTPLSTKSTKKNGNFTSVFWHREKSPFGQQKSPIDSGFSQETSILSSHYGGDEEI